MAMSPSQGCRVPLHPLVSTRTTTAVGGSAAEDQTGCVVALRSFLLGEPLSSAWKAETPCTLWRLSQQAFASVLQQYPDAALQLFQEAFGSSSAVNALKACWAPSMLMHDPMILPYLQSCLH